MNQKLPKKLVIGLIFDDLNHTKLIRGLNLLGFDSDRYGLNTSRVLFYVMDLNTEDRRLDRITDDYCERTARVEEFAGNDVESLDILARDIYNWLIRERKKYRRKLLKNVWTSKYKKNCPQLVGSFLLNEKEVFQPPL